MTWLSPGRSRLHLDYRREEEALRAELRGSAVNMLISREWTPADQADTDDS